MLSDGTELKGQVRFDDRLGILGYKEGEESKSLTPRRVMAFEFFDKRINKQRFFYTLEEEDPKTQMKKPYFFEVLKDFKTFAVIAKIDPVQIEEKGGSTGYSSQSTTREVSNWSSTSYKEVIRQKETIYFMNESGQIEPYLQVTRKVVDRAMYDRDKKKKRVLDGDVIQRYFTPTELQAMDKFADEKELDFEVKEELLQILDYADVLRSKK